MCIPSNVASLALGVTKTVAGDIFKSSQQQKQYAYRTQIAINNANSMNNEAKRQKQLGIEKARIDRLDGINQMRAQIAKNSASGFDVSSSTNLNNYNDILNSANQKANTTLNDYNSTAESYFSKANEYLNQANDIQKQANQNSFLKAMQLTSDIKSVASDWYGKMDEGFF